MMQRAHCQLLKVNRHCPHRNTTYPPILSLSPLPQSPPRSRRRRLVRCLVLRLLVRRFPIRRRRPSSRRRIGRHVGPRRRCIRCRGLAPRPSCRTGSRARGSGYARARRRPTGRSGSGPRGSGRGLASGACAAAATAGGPDDCRCGGGLGAVAQAARGLRACGWARWGSSG